MSEASRGGQHDRCRTESDTARPHGRDVGSRGRGRAVAGFCDRECDCRVQDWLYDAGSVGWLALARIAMGYPLLAVALFVTWGAVRRARGRSATAAVAETIAA
ncbi:DUF3159 domain-containing protein [Mycolicibacterium hippocampi]|uniref:DUF3159 domain-containing protein n=1 Tax=Mycolicibacterium hippocampi TaxID=659824 RepID=UPI003515877B